MQRPRPSAGEETRIQSEALGAGVEESRQLENGKPTRKAKARAGWAGVGASVRTFRCVGRCDLRSVIRSATKTTKAKGKGSYRG